MTPRKAPKKRRNLRKAVEVQTWYAEAYNLYLRGKTIRRVASELGRSVGQVHHAIHHVIDSLPTVLTEDDRRIQGEKYSELENELQGLIDQLRPLAASDKDASTAYLKAIAECRSLGETRSRLFGWNAPDKSEVSAKVITGRTPADAARIMKEQFGSVTPEALAAGTADVEPTPEGPTE